MNKYYDLKNSGEKIKVSMDYDKGQCDYKPRKRGYYLSIFIVTIEDKGYYKVETCEPYKGLLVYFLDVTRNTSAAKKAAAEKFERECDLWALEYADKIGVEIIDGALNCVTI